MRRKTRTTNKEKKSKTEGEDIMQLEEAVQ
jgi:hypothetical protein